MIGRLTHERMLDAIEAQVGLVRFVLAGPGDDSWPAVDLAVDVVSCPGWTVRDLVVHLGTANWWGGANVRARDPEQRARGMRAVMDSAPPASAGATALADWYAGLADEMIRTFTDAAPDAPAWTFAGPGRADYWLRRQLHETAVHRWDLEHALGGLTATTPLPEDVAVDTVDEFCEAMRPIMSAALPPLPVTIRLRAILQAPERLSTGAEPVGSRAPGAGLEWTLPGGDGAGEVDVAGPPETLALLLWGRVRADEPDLEISGDRAGLDAALEARLTV